MSVDWPWGEDMFPAVPSQSRRSGRRTQGAIVRAKRGFNRASRRAWQRGGSVLGGPLAEPEELVGRALPSSTENKPGVARSPAPKQPTQLITVAIENRVSAIS